MPKSIDEKKRTISTAAVNAILSTLKDYVDSKDSASEGELEDLARTVAYALNDLDARTRSIEEQQGQPFGPIVADSINAQVMPMVGGKAIVLTGSGAPQVAPDFVGQFYIDTSAPNVYFATATGSVNGWKKPVYDANYVHTDNNFTTALKNKLADLYDKTTLDSLLSGKEPVFTFSYDAQTHALITSKRINLPN